MAENWHYKRGVLLFVKVIEAPEYPNVKNVGGGLCLGFVEVITKLELAKRKL